jgi:hypothetical protein
MDEPFNEAADFPDLMTRALDLTRQALALLDQAGAPSDIGAHLDLAAVRIERILGILSSLGH